MCSLVHLSSLLFFALIVNRWLWINNLRSLSSCMIILAAYQDYWLPAMNETCWWWLITSTSSSMHDMSISCCLSFTVCRNLVPYASHVRMFNCWSITHDSESELLKEITIHFFTLSNTTEEIMMFVHDLRLQKQHLIINPWWILLCTQYLPLCLWFFKEG